MNKKFKLGLILFLIGFVGVLSILTMTIPLPDEIQEMVSQIFTPWQFKLLSLINPTFFLLSAVVAGTLLYDKVKFRLPILESLIYKDRKNNSHEILRYGVSAGIISGILIIITTMVFMPVLPAAFIELGDTFKPSLAARFLYGGITEEILIRFGVMTFIVWLLFKITKKLTPLVYWTGILASAILFGIGHLPIVYTLVGTPTVTLIWFIILGNTIGGVIFGWLYWKKGLEAAMIAHIFTHITMLIGESLFNI